MMVQKQPIGNSGNQALVSQRPIDNQSQKIIIIDKPLDSLNISALLRKEKNLSIVAIANNFLKGFSNIKQSKPDSLLLNPEVLSDSELKEILDYSNLNRIDVFIFASSSICQRVRNIRSLGIKKYIDKPDKLNQLTSEDQSYQTLLNSLVPNTSTLSRVPVKQSDNTIKVMLIDDAALMKVVISNMLATDPNMKLVGQASNGQEALQRLQSIQPDIILLDIEMPVMDGLTFLEKLDRSKKTAKVIILSSVANENTLKARKLGADAIINKPSGAVSMDLAEKTGSQLLGTIRRLAKS